MEVVPQSKQRVLVVDDEPQMLTALEDLLADSYNVLTTTSAQRAIELLDRERDIAVLLTDQRMPKMSGDELLATIDGRCDAQGIIITGYADLRAVSRAVNTGKLFAYITKPWNPTDLLDKVERAAQQFQQSRRLANDQQLLHDLLDHSPDGIFFKDRELRFVEANRAFWTMLGLTDRSQLVGKRTEDLVRDPELVGSVDQEEHEVIRARTPSREAIRAYGDVEDKGRWLAETRAPVSAEDHTVVGLVGIARDVTDRVKTQQALTTSEDLLRKQTGLLNAILQGLAEGVVVADTAGNFLMANAEAERILGVGANALSVANWTAVCGMFDARSDTPLTPESDPLARASEGVALSEREVWLHRPGGDRKRISISATPLRDADGAITGGVALLCDVTDRHEMEQRLGQAQKMDAIGRLAGGVAHDFNNLLSIIQTCGELVLRDLGASDPQRTELGHILTAANRAAILTRQLLSFSRQQVIKPKTLQLNEIVAQTDGMLRRVIGEHIEIVTELDETLGHVSIDVNQLEQIILNLAVNARDAMPEGGELRIETRNVSVADGGIAGLRGGEYVLLAMRDSANRIDGQSQRHIFGPQFTAKDAARGVGIGLSTVHGIVEQNGGHVRFGGDPHRGTAFEVYLKRVDDHAAAPLARSSRPVRAAKDPASILLVEDEDNVRRIAAAILRRQGHTVLEARRPSEAVRLCALAQHPIDLLLTDVIMPESSGPQLAAELRSRHPAMSVLYMSGYSTDDVLMGMNTRDGVTFLQKPFTPALLIEAVSEAMTVSLQ